MAALKLLVAWIFISLAILGVRSDGRIDDNVAPEPTFRSELEALRSKIYTLESSIEDGTREIKIKEDSITKLEKVIQEKSEKLALLQSEIESLQKKDVAGAAKAAEKPNPQVSELEKKIVKLKNDIRAQSKRSDALEAQASEAEKKVEELNLKLDTLQKTNKKQKLRIEETRQAVEVAEEELMRAQLEAASRFQELPEVNEAWLPPWLVIHITHIQELVVTHWNGHAKPALTFVLQKASEKSEHVQKWAGPHLDAAKHKLMPAVKEQLVIIQTNAGPYLKKIYSKTFEVHEASMNAIAPHVVKVQELTDPYLQEVMRISKPYIDQVVTVINPHLQKVQLVLKPYNKNVARAYRSFLKTVRTYHRLGRFASISSYNFSCESVIGVQDNLYEELKKHQLTKPHATKELARFMASASLALPVFFLYRVLVENFCKKAKKPRRKSHASQAPRRNKRRHAEK